MTTLIGIQGDGFAVVGADTRISSFDNSGNAYQLSTLGTGSSKIAANGKYILGAAGEMRAINILHHVFIPPAPPQGIRGKKLDSFITGKFIPSLSECFDANGYSIPESKNDKEHLIEQNSTIMAVVNGTIYLIENDYSWVCESTGIYASGTGAPYALGALTVLAQQKSFNIPQAKNAVLKALSVASKLDPYTGSPFHTMVQDVQVKPVPPKRKVQKK